MLKKPAVMIVTIMSFILFSTLFFTACEDNLLLTEPTMSGSAPESAVPESPVPEDPGSLAKGQPGNVGFDEFGYNYRANMFNGRYCDYDRVIGGNYCDVDLIMKWSDEWLNEDRIRCEGTPQQGSSACEGAWLTNHQSGLTDDGKKWTYFVKIVAVPEDAYVVDGNWYTADDVEIGPVIWGAYAIIQQVSNDPSLGEHGILYKSPASPGFGVYKP